jgi:hypothetical protein
LLLLNKSRPSPASRPPRFRCVFSAARSFFLFNDTDLIVGVFFSHTARAFDDDANFLPYLILQKRIDVCDDARERSDLRCALLVSPREWTKTNARNNASSRRCVVRSLEVDPQRIDFWDLTTLWEENILVREPPREKKIFDFRFDFITHEWLVRRETDLFFSLKLFFIYYYQSKSISKVVKADIYPEFGTYPGGGESPIIPFGDEKNAEREIIHGRWAQLGVTGAWAAENGTGIPWFTAGTLCTPDDCTAVADKFPGAVAPLAPEGSGYPSFWNVLIIETVLVGAAEAYRTGLAANPFDDGLVAGDVSPGGRFDPLGLAESGDLEELKIKELKHCRLSMFAWLGCIMQALATQEGPIANWTAHTADPVHANVLTNAAKGFGFY